jgi:hypothetical protein
MQCDCGNFRVVQAGVLARTMTGLGRLVLMAQAHGSKSDAQLRHGRGN